MTEADKFMLYGKWDIDGNQGKSRNFKASFYRRSVNDATRNHTYQIDNFRVDNNAPTQSSSDKCIDLRYFGCWNKWLEGMK